MAGYIPSLVKMIRTSLLISENPPFTDDVPIFQTSMYVDFHWGKSSFYIVDFLISEHSIIFLIFSGFSLFSTGKSSYLQLDQ